MSEKAPDITPHLSFEMKHRLGALDIDAAFNLTQPWTVLFGPSGSGKSTILRAIGGLFRPAQSRIVLRQRHRRRYSVPSSVQVAADTTRNIFLPAYKRAVRWTAQRPALFPHMTVRQNLRFVSDSHPSDLRNIVDAAVKHFRLTAVADELPTMLSGGEEHRVSLARAAVAANGRLLLLDEPFTGLDTPLRDELLASLRGWLADSQTPVLSVTHDIGEAFLLDAEIIRLHEGRVLQQGPVAEVLAAERARLLKQLGPS